MNKKSINALAGLMAASAVLVPNYETHVCISEEKKTKERTIRKCADPKKKAKRKAKQESQRRNRR